MILVTYRKYANLKDFMIDAHTKCTMLREQVEQIESVTATDESLAYVKNNFDGLPMSPNLRSNTWPGDMAKFIIMNLPLVEIQ